MTLSLLQLAQETMSRVGFASPASVMSGNDIAYQMRGMINETAADLRRRHDWSALREAGEITTTADRLQETFLTNHPDFAKLVPDTVWNTTNQQFMSGPLSPVRWNRLIASGVSPWAYSFRLRAGALEIPAPTAGETITFEYISNYWVTDSAGTPKAAFTLDTDKTRLDDELLILGAKWRFKKEKGLEYGEDFNDYEKAVSEAIGIDKATGIVSLVPMTPPDVNIPEGDFPSD